MSTPMLVLISLEPAQPQWGEKALISFSEQGAVIHLTAADDLDTIQRAARKFDSQGLRHLFLQGEGWTLETIWAFYQGYRDPKKKNSLEWNALENAAQTELEARIKVADWTRDIINK